MDYTRGGFKVEYMLAVPKAISSKFTNMSLFCALLVVFIHVTPWMTDSVELWKNGQFWTWVLLHLFKQGICQIAVPFFFFASGFFAVGHVSQKNWYKAALKKRVFTLLIPYVIWNGLYIAMCRFFNGGEVSLVRDFGLTFSSPALSSLWYVRNLFFLIIMSPAIVKAVKHQSLSIVWLSVLFSLYYIIHPWPWHHRWHGLYYFFQFSALFWFSLGAFVRLRRCDVLLNGSYRLMALFVGFLFLVLRSYTGLCGCSWSYCFGVVAIPFLLYAVWHLLPSSDVLHSWTAIPFGLYLSHKVVICVLNHFGLCHIGWAWPSAMRMVWQWLFVVIVSLVVCSILRLVPVCSRLFLGGR